MALTIYNSLTKREEEFRPMEGNKVKIYVCGVTVYDDIHMGHARSIIAFDMIVRYLRSKGYDVTHLTNFTDVDDKIINRANETDMDPLDLSRMYIEHYFRDVQALGVKKADAYPKASETIDAIIKMTKEIMDNGYAYEVHGSVYFSVDKVKDYGKLSGQKLQDMIAGARIEVDEEKKNPMDFALWKAAKPGEISWPSPWGKGRPGWHIECSAMCTEHLGRTIDIHGGGNDLVFPHHENEILQSEAANGAKMANFWVHNGMLQVQGTKMSKSLKNFFTVKDMLGLYTKEELRFYLLNTHYRGPLIYSEEALNEASASLKRLHNTVHDLRRAVVSANGTNDAADVIKRFEGSYSSSMDQDFNSRGALSGMFDMVREVNKLITDGNLSKKGARDILTSLQKADEIFGILPGEEEIRTDVSGDIIQMLVETREELRKRKQYDLADSIRNKLADKGIELQDTSDGVKWKWTKAPQR